MKYTCLSSLMKMAVLVLGLLAFCGLEVYGNGELSVALLVTPGCLLLAWGVYQVENQMYVAHRRYKVKRKGRIRMATSSGPARVA